MNWVLLTILAIISRSSYSISVKLLSNRVKVSPITHSVLIALSGMILVFPIAPFIGGISFVGIDRVWVFIFICVITQSFGNILFFEGLKSLDTGAAQIAFSSILIWGVLFSNVFLGSRFDGAQMLGVGLMILAILLVQYNEKALSVNKSIITIILSAMLFAVFQVFSARVSQVLSAGGYLILMYLGSSLVITLFYSKTIMNDSRKLLLGVKNKLIYILFASSTGVLYFIFSFLAYRISPDSGVVVTLLSTQVILSVIFGVIFLKERDNLIRKLVAGLLALVAAVLIKS